MILLHSSVAFALGALLAAVVLLFLYSRRRRARGPAISHPQAAESARQSMEEVRQILVPTGGHPYAERAVELACRLGEAQKATVNLVSVLVVPRSLPLGTPLPEEETQAKTALARADSIVRSHGLAPKTWVERARSPAEGILFRAQELHAHLIVVGMRPPEQNDDSLLDRTTTALLRSAPCEVMVNMQPLDKDA